MRLDAWTGLHLVTSAKTVSASPMINVVQVGLSVFLPLENYPLLMQALVNRTVHHLRPVVFAMGMASALDQTNVNVNHLGLMQLRTARHAWSDFMDRTVTAVQWETTTILQPRLFALIMEHAVDQAPHPGRGLAPATLVLMESTVAHAARDMDLQASATPQYVTHHASMGFVVLRTLVPAIRDFPAQTVLRVLAATGLRVSVILLFAPPLVNMETAVLRIRAHAKQAGSGKHVTLLHVKSSQTAMEMANAVPPIHALAKKATRATRVRLQMRNAVPQLSVQP